MKYIKLTKNKKTTVDDNMFEYLNQWKWCLGHNYAIRREYIKKVNGKWESKVIYMHRIINNTPNNLFTDHINRNKLDNRKENLRTVNKSQNAINTGLRKDNKTGYKGINWDKERKKWFACIYAKNKTIALGRFNELKIAIAARKLAERRYFGTASNI